MNSGIYKITSPSDKIYVGQTTNLDKRFKDYLNLNCKGQVKLYNSLKKYGVKNHKFEILEECTEDLLNERELYWGSLFKVNSSIGLNCKLPGKQNQWSKDMIEEFKKKRNTEEWISFISKIHKNKVVSDKTRSKQSNSHKGKKQSEETIIKRNIRNKKSKEHIEKFIKSKSKPIRCNELSQNFNSIKEASIYLNIDRSIINKILKGIKYNYKGYTFNYITK